jgi:cell division initiation protein
VQEQDFKTGAMGSQKPVVAHTPHGIRTIELPRARLRGYRRKDVEQLLDDLADTLAGALRERDRLGEQFAELTAKAEEALELETLLRSTLVAAEKAAHETKAQARRESDLIVQEAHAESRRATRETTARKRQLEDQLVEIKARLRSALETLDPPVSTPDEHETESQTPSLGEALDSGVRKVVG